MRIAGDRTRRRRLNKLSYAGWVPHDRGSVSGLPCSRIERRSEDRLITGHKDSPPVVLPPAMCTLDFSGAPFSLVQFRRPSQMSSGCATRAIAQMKPTISRATAVVTTTFGLPAAARCRYRAHNRTCAFQAMSLMAADRGSRRS